MQSNNHPPSVPGLPDESARRISAEQVFWSTVGTLYRWRRLILWATGGVAVVAVVASLLLPNQYQATARVLTPESGGGLSAALLRNLPSAASALLGSSGEGDYIRYMAILNSRTVWEATVDSFDLVHRYEVEDDKNPREAALKQLGEYVDFALDEKFDYLSVSAVDTDPKHAADMANFLVRKLNEVNNRLSAQSAHTYRTFIERRYLEAEAAMDSVLAATQRFQQEYGVYDLPAQTQSFFEQVGDLRAQALQAEIEYEVRLEQYGAANSSVEAARQLARAANDKYQDALQGQERLMPFPQQAVPDVARRYAELEMERAIQVAILEIVRPMYEQARMQEEQQKEAVQVLDPAVPPVKKIGPRRSVIVVVSTLSAFLLASLYALVMTWWQGVHAAVAARLQRAIAPPDAERTERTTVSS